VQVAFSLPAAIDADDVALCGEFCDKNGGCSNEQAS
jgi:hypothetical protein